MSNNKNVLILITVAIIAIVLYAVLTMPDQRSASERVSDAVDALPQGVGEAAEQLEKRTPGEKIGDTIKDATDNQPD